MIAKSDTLFKLILKCHKNHFKPDIHSFWVDIKNGRAYVEGRPDGVYLEWYDDSGNYKQCGTPVAIANKLDKLGAISSTVDM